MKKNLIAIAFFVMAVGLATANATTQTFTASGTGSDGALSASAVFTTSAGQIQVVLTNTLSVSSLVSAGQALSDISFTLSTAPGTLGTTSASGQLGNLSGGNPGPKTATFAAGDPTRWFGIGGGVFTIIGSNVTMEVIGGGQPSQMILPGVANGGTYANANASLLNFNPSVIGPGTFTIHLSGVTAGTTVSNVQFSFGTSPDTFIPGVPGEALVPEPASILLIGAGLSALCVFGRRKLRK